MKTLRTVILDDHQSFREFLRKFLAGFEFIEVVGEAGSEKEGLEAVKEQLPHLVIVDIRLMGVGGFEFARILKNRYPRTQVLFVTMFDNIVYRREAQKLGFPYIPKDSLLEKLPPFLKGLSGKRGG